MAPCPFRVVRRTSPSCAMSPSVSKRRRASAPQRLLLPLDVCDDVERLLAELLVVDLLRVDERAAEHRDRTHRARFGDLVVGRAEEANRFGVEERAVLAARCAGDREAD